MQSANGTFSPCPSCGTPLRRPDTVRFFVTFPDDPDSVIDLCNGTFNTVVHSCGQRVHHGGPVAARNTRTGELLIAPDTDASRAAALADAARAPARGLGSLRELAAVVGGWLQADVDEFLSRVLRGDLERMTSRERLDVVTPSLLAALKLVRSVDTPTSGAPADERTHWARLSVELTVRHVVDVVRVAVLDGQVPLEDSLRRSAPSAWLDATVLGELTRRTTTPGLPELGPRFGDRLLGALACAVAHDTAGMVNPAAREFAALVEIYHDVESREDVEVAGRFVVAPSTYRRLVPEAVALAAAQRLVTRCAEQGRSDPDAAGRALLQRLGREDSYDRLLQTAAVERMRRHLQSAPPDAYLDLTDTVLQEELTRAATTDAQDDGGPDVPGEWTAGTVAATSAYLLLRAVAHDVATQTYEELARRVDACGVPLAVCGFHSHLTFLGNRDRWFSLSLLTANRLIDLIDVHELPPVCAATALIESGNAARYTHHHVEALALYDRAAQVHRDADQPEEQDALLQRNRALVLRDAGDYHRAGQILTEQVARRPHDVDLGISLALLHQQTGAHRAGIEVTTRLLTRPGLDLAELLQITVVHALLLVADERHDEAVRTVREVAAPFAEHAEQFWSLAAAVLSARPTQAEEVAFADECEAFAVAAVDRLAPVNSSAALTLGLHAVRRRLRRGRLDDEDGLLARTRAVAGDEADGPWQLSTVLGWWALLTGDGDALQHLNSAVAQLDEEIPTGENADYALTVLEQDDIVLLQRLVIRSTVRAVLQGTASVDDLVPVVDFVSGREVTSRAALHAVLPEPGELLAALEHWQKRSGADVVAFLEVDDDLYALVSPAGSPRRLRKLDVSVQELTQAVDSLSAMNSVNPAAPHRRDTRLAPWWSVARRLAAAVVEELPGNCELVVVPSSRLVATPLLAAGWPDQPLIARRPVSMALNHRLLIGRPRLAYQRNRVDTGIVAVTKQKDTETFRAAVDDALGALTAVDPRTEVLQGPAADSASVLDLVGRARTLLMLCHGVDGGSLTGPGLCLAADGLLPPDWLPVGRDEQLGPFVLGWRDILEVRHPPRTFVSIACSSARTLVGRAGTRLGFEQSLLGNGTSFLVAPGWNVAQASALAWIQAFVAALPRMSGDVVAAHREATLQTATGHDHPYHWAPFVLLTSLRGGPDD